MDNKLILKHITDKCDNCGGSLKFSPNGACLKCEHCLSTFDIEFTTKIPKHNLEFNDDVEKEKEINTRVFKCSTCGADIILNSLEISKLCPYCHNATVIKKEEIKGLVPDKVVLFEFDKFEANKKFIAGVKKKFFVPNKFKKEMPESNINGFYFASFGFDAKTVSKYSGVLAKTETYTINGKTHTRTVNFKISGNNSSNFTDILVESSSKLTQKQLSEIEPYNITKCVDYDERAILGYEVEEHNNMLKTSSKESENIMYNRIKQKVLKKYSYSYVVSYSMDTKYSDRKYLYHILPVYNFNYEYKNKKYNTFMNGQTGKIGEGLPVSKVKVAFTVLFGILILALPFILSYFL